MWTLLPRAAPPRLLQLPGEPPPTTPTMGGWLQRALRRVHAAPPRGFTYTGHALRSGGASAAKAIRVPAFRANWLGGWAPRSLVRKQHYLDPSVLPTPAAFSLLGWLLDGDYATA